MASTSEAIVGGDDVGDDERNDGRRNARKEHRCD